MKEVCVGLVGSGYAAFLHGNAYKKVSGISLRLKTVVDIDLAKAEYIRKQYGFEQMLGDYDALLQDDDIDIVDICTPPFLHCNMIAKALKAEKNVICEKPLSGYFGCEGDVPPIGKTVPKAKMYEHLIREMDWLKQLLVTSGERVMYAENYVYSPPVQKAAEFLRSKKSKILFLKGGETLHGSSSPVAGEWKSTGGGVLIRSGIHPLAACLWLKQVEAKARGEKIWVESVVAETGHTTQCLSPHEHRHILTTPKDVEDFASVTINFSDGTKALIISADTALGGTKNFIDIYCNDCTMNCKLSPPDLLQTYFLDEDGIQDVYMGEMVSTKLGWNKIFVSDEVIRGYTGELQDFAEAVAYDREPESTFDLAYQTLKVLYAAYASAEEGKRIRLENGVLS